MRFTQTKTNGCTGHFFKNTHATSKVFKKESTENDFRFLVNARKTVTIQTKPYIQVFQVKHGYISNLSILDLLFNMGPETLNYLKTHPPIQINT